MNGAKLLTRRFAPSRLSFHRFLFSIHKVAAVAPIQLVHDNQTTSRTFRNDPGTINEFALEQMELVVGCTQQLKAHALVSDLPQDEDNNLSELADYFPR